MAARPSVPDQIRRISHLSVLENLLISKQSLAFGRKAHFQLEVCTDWRIEFLGMRFSDYWEMILQAYISNLWIFRNEKLSRIYIFWIHQWFWLTILGVRGWVSRQKTENISLISLSSLSHLLTFRKLNQTERRTALYLFPGWIMRGERRGRRSKCDHTEWQQRVIRTSHQYLVLISRELCHSNSIHFINC